MKKNKEEAQLHIASTIKTKCKQRNIENINRNPHAKPIKASQCYIISLLSTTVGLLRPASSNIQENNNEEQINKISAFPH